MTPAANVGRPAAASSTASPASSRSPPTRSVHAGISTSRCSTIAQPVNRAELSPTRPAPTQATARSSSRKVFVTMPTTSVANTRNASTASTIAGRSSGDRSTVSSSGPATAGEPVGEAAHAVDDVLHRLDQVGGALELGDQLAELAPQLDDLARQRLDGRVHLHELRLERPRRLRDALDALVQVGHPAVHRSGRL